MKRKILQTVFAGFSLYLLSISVYAADFLIPVGRVIGLELYDDTVTVAAFDDTLTVARDSGLQIGDEILSIDEIEVDSAEDVRQALNRSNGSVDLVISRSGQEQQIHMEPAITTYGPRLGIYLRQGITGIGTVTFYDPDTNCFGTLGHAVNDSKGNLLAMTKGKVYPATVVSIQKGKVGQPGQLKGALNADQLLGTLTGNTEQGVFGTAATGWEGEAMPVAAYSEVRTGEAMIRSTIADGEPQDYSVEIMKIYPQSRADGRNFLIKVTDPDLLAATGGIVQGMGVIDNMDNTKSQ